MAEVEDYHTEELGIHTNRAVMLLKEESIIIMDYNMGDNAGQEQVTIEQ